MTGRYLRARLPYHFGLFKFTAKMWRGRKSPLDYMCKQMDYMRKTLRIPIFIGVFAKFAWISFGERRRG